jgi:hypothetical protein
VETLETTVLLGQQQSSIVGLLRQFQESRTAQGDIGLGIATKKMPPERLRDRRLNPKKPNENFFIETL